MRKGRGGGEVDVKGGSVGRGERLVRVKIVSMMVVPSGLMIPHIAIVVSVLMVDPRFPPCPVMVVVMVMMAHDAGSRMWSIDSLIRRLRVHSYDSRAATRGTIEVLDRFIPLT